ncbi:MAG: MFS transporter [Candidatus Dormibacteraeota bacterium]|nr:MFS transporter [Candidatus Dormibacteraeota bacterium]MBO0705868.1 MFS transporter [Candidatus Dormibacteraeota bacterium]MBO0761806.1 MFS transporter [Candidatus Dormibacteraeota bacterium]
MLGRTFRSLRVRNYRLYFFGQVVSVSGTWMQQIAQAWLVLHLHGNGIDLGVVAALRFVPMLVLGPWGGLLADRMDKRLLLVATQAAAGILAAVLAAVTLTGAVTLGVVYLLVLLLGLVQVVDNPTRQAFASELVGPAEVSNAVSLNSAVFTSARVFGPALGGILIALVGTGWCFALNAVSYIAVIVALALMRPAELYSTKRAAGARGQVREGLGYAWRTPRLRWPLLLLLIVGTFAFNFNVLLPLMASQVFHADASAFGTMMALMGVGALAGALASASRARPTWRLIGLSAAGLGLFLGGTAAAPSLLVAMVVLVPVGMAMTTFQATSNSFIQLAADPSLRGRVMALYVTVFLGTTPIGAPLVGLIAQVTGARAGLVVGAVAALAAGVLAVAVRSRIDEPGV